MGFEVGASWVSGAGVVELSRGVCGGLFEGRGLVDGDAGGVVGVADGALD